MRLARTATACIVFASAGASAQTPQPIDLGNGMYAAIGVAVGAGGGGGATAVAVPQSNTFLIVTADGNVIVDTSGPAASGGHHRMLTAVRAAPIKALVLTPGHGDHTGGVAQWPQPGTDVSTHSSFPEFLQYQRRPAGFFQNRNAAQFGGGNRLAPVAAPGGARQGAGPPWPGARPDEDVR